MRLPLFLQFGFLLDLFKAWKEVIQLLSLFLDTGDSCREHARRRHVLLYLRKPRLREVVLAISHVHRLLHFICICSGLSGTWDEDQISLNMGNTWSCPWWDLYCLICYNKIGLQGVVDQRGFVRFVASWGVKLLGFGSGDGFI